MRVLVRIIVSITAGENVLLDHIYIYIYTGCPTS